MNEWEVIVRTIVALAAGGAIGLERTYHGRAAGLRTYALVSFGSALFVGIGQYVLISARDSGEIARIIQGIVTGVGFLGAGVIVKEGFSVRGLTTAASIWVAAAIGVALGTGSYWTGLASTVVTLVALSILRRIEDRLPSQTFVQFEVAFRRASTIDEERLREIIRNHDFRISEFAYRLEGDSQSLEYRGVIWANAPARLRELERSLVALPDVLHFRMSRTRE